MTTPTPAAHVILAFGTQSAVAAVLNLDRSTVCRWLKPVSEKGTGGRVPAKYQRNLLAAARAQNLPLSAEQLIG